MKISIVPIVLGLFLHDTTAVPHSLKYFYTGFSGVPGFPEFVAVGMVDDSQINHYDSNTQRDEPKQDWMSRVTEEDPQYFQGTTEIYKGAHQSFRAGIENIKPRFNQTGGVHILQVMYGCEWDDETNKLDGFYQFGYDGEDFLVLDLNTQTWTAPQQQAVITKQKWDKDEAEQERRKNYLTQVCVDWLKKYVDYGRSSLMRTVLPSVSFLQKSPSSPVTCHASGFYPNSAVMFWRKDGEKLHEDVEPREILPNHDGTFQMSVDLEKLPSDDWGSYECVFQLAGGKEEKVTKLNEARIRTNFADSTNMIIVIIVVVLLLVLALAAVFGYKVLQEQRHLL